MPISAIAPAIRPCALSADALSHTVKQGGGGRWFPSGTCSPCPVRRQTVARLVGALVHKEAPPEGGPLRSVGVQVFASAPIPSTWSARAGAPNDGKRPQPTKVPSPRAVKRTWFHRVEPRVESAELGCGSC